MPQKMSNRFIDKNDDILQQMDDGYYETDREGLFTYCNPAFIRLTGMEDPVAGQKTFSNIADPETLEQVATALTRVWKTGQRIDGIAYTFIQPSGETRTGQMSVCRLQEGAHHPVGFYGIVKDRTQMTALKEDLAINQAGLERMISSRTLEMQEEIEQKEYVKTINNALFAISKAINTARNLDELYPVIYRHLNDIIRMDHFYIGILNKHKDAMDMQYRVDPAARPLKVLKRITLEGTMAGHALKRQQPLLMKKVELVEKKWDVDRFGPVPETWLGVPLISQDRVIGIMMAYSENDPEAFSKEQFQVLTSVSDQVGFAIERRQILDQLSAREKKYRQLIETTTAGYWQLDAQGRTLDVNQALCDMLGYARDELMGEDAARFVAEQSKKTYKMEFVQRPNSRDRQYEMVFQTREGQTLYTKIDATSIFDDEDQFNGSFAVITDITDRILFQKEMSRAKERAEEASRTTQNILDKLQAGVVLIDATTHIIEQVNPAAAFMFGSPADEIVGNVCHNFLCPKEKGSCPVTDLGGIVDNAERYMLNVHKEKIPILKTVSRISMKGRPYLLETFVDITVQKKTEEKLVAETQRANEMAAQAREASKAKSQFLANMSHEIRTPLNGVIGMAELLTECTLGQEQQNLVETIGSEADSLLGIINSILDFSKIEAGKMDLEQIPFDLRHLFEEFSRAIAVRAEKEKLDFLSYLDPAIPTRLVGDPGRLRQVFMNLVGNALKFTHQGQIFISGKLVSQTPKKAVVWFEVTDTGIGIPKDKQEMVFQSFSQADGSTTRKYGGTGLGTTISKQLVEMMGGEIGLASEPGKGSKFWFIIGFDKQAEKETLQPPVSNNLAGTRVLVVENNETLQYILSKYLNALDCISNLAADSETAMKWLEPDEPSVDLILIDHQLPDQNGFEFAKTVKQTGRLKHLPLILMASAGISGDGQRCREIGIDGYLAKPVRREDLKTTMASVLGMMEAVEKEDRRLVTRHYIEELYQKQTRIMVVEDYPTNQQVALRHLKNAGFDAVLARNGSEAVELFKSSNFDIILMDIQMPVMDGYTATQEIRKIEAGISKKLDKKCRIPIIATTAHAMKGYREKCIQAQMDDYLTKPLKKKDLIRMVKRWLPKEDHQTKTEQVKPVAQPFSPAEGDKAEDKTMNQEHPPIDMKQALAEFDNDTQFFTEVLDEFIQEVNRQIEVIRKAMNDQDFPTIAKESHSIKGGAANLLASHISSAAMALEQMAKAPQDQDVEMAVDRLSTAHQDLVRYVSSGSLKKARS